jgi:hypothetical protein
LTSIQTATTLTSSASLSHIYNTTTRKGYSDINIEDT